MKLQRSFTHVFRLEPPYTGVPRPCVPEILKKSQKGLPRPPGPKCQKSVEKVPKDPTKSQTGVKFSVRGLFRHFSDTPGGEARGDPFDTFGDLGARGCGDSCIWGLPSFTPVATFLRLIGSDCFTAHSTIFGI